MYDCFIGGKSIAEVVRLFGYMTVHDNGDVVVHEYTPTWESSGYYSEGDKLRLGCIKDRNGNRIGAQINEPIRVLADIMLIAKCDTVFYCGALEDVCDDNDGVANLNDVGVAISRVVTSWLWG